MKKHMFIIVGMLFLFAMGVMGCDREEESPSSRTKIRLLSIGNSYSQDALAYVPFIIQNMGVDVDIQIGILMQSSATLAMHVDNYTNESAAYTFYLYNGGSSWQKLGKKTIKWAMDNYQWDIVSLQQGSGSAYRWSTCQPYLNKLINLIDSYVTESIKFMWYQTQTRPAQSNNGANWDDETIVDHYVNTSEASKRIMEETSCEILVPVGTAIQNARSIASIKALGDYANNPLNTSGKGYLTCKDGVHLQEGLPCQIAAYTFVQVLLDVYGFKDYSIIGETTRVTADWASEKSIPGPHGDYIGSDDTNSLIAQKCAIMAIENPYEVTDMNETSKVAPKALMKKSEPVWYSVDGRSFGSKPSKGGVYVRKHDGQKPQKVRLTR